MGDNAGIYRLDRFNLVILICNMTMVACMDEECLKYTDLRLELLKLGCHTLSFGAQQCHTLPFGAQQCHTLPFGASYAAVRCPTVSYAVARVIR